MQHSNFLYVVPASRVSLSRLQLHALTVVIPANLALRIHITSIKLPDVAVHTVLQH